MALIKSTILAQISGSVNGITFAHNRGGSYMRNRSIPLNPQSQRQDEVRTALSVIAKAWATSLTDSQRVAWIAYGAATKVINALGDQITLSGIAAFQRVNLFRISTLGSAMLLNPPAISPTRDPAPSFTSWASTGNTPSSTAIAQIELAGPSTDYSLAVYYSDLVPAGINYFRGPYPYRTTQAVVGTNPQSVTLTGITIPAAPPNGRVAAKITLYDTVETTPIWTVNTAPTELLV